MSLIINKAKELTMSYLLSENPIGKISQVLEELRIITGESFEDAAVRHPLGYTSVQDSLATINEKEYIRKSKGVYYTPMDVVGFIIANTIKVQNKQIATNIVDKQLLLEESITKKTVLDPTCGAGEFLVSFLTAKLQTKTAPTKQWIKGVVGTIYGNDINPESTTIAKIRLLLCIFHKYGDTFTKGIGEILNRNFTNYDFVVPADKIPLARFDYIVGNPPYVEDAKCETPDFERFGNIYCNVLCNSVKMLKSGGAIGFIIPLSYISTPRMKKIRHQLQQSLATQIILSYADRPDCLFTSVHQKLCILVGKEGKGGKVFTGAYQYWYKDERPLLFDRTEIYETSFATDEYIPKIGSALEESIFRKITHQPKPLLQLLNGHGHSIFLNMRACFWIKAFTEPHVGAEYKTYACDTKEEQKLALGILNSSLFWWYWVCVSDCWHITRKELRGFKVPNSLPCLRVLKLADAVEEKLELTKKYVGTKQTDYEYKHKNCLSEIEALDKAINSLFGLTEEESNFIIEFAKRYRTGGGTE